MWGGACCDAEALHARMRGESADLPPGYIYYIISSLSEILMQFWIGDNQMNRPPRLSIGYISYALITPRL